MIKLFKHLKEMSELKKMKLEYEVIVLGKIFEFVNGGSDILDLANKLKDVDQKDIVSELVKHKKDGKVL
jgi:hypothetical protein